MFGIYKAEGLYYLCSENKGADLHLCFCISKSRFSYNRAHIKVDFMWGFKVHGRVV